MDKRYFSKKVAKWYKENYRNLPWRNTREPYRIWLSEIILQQTRVSQGLPYYERFIEKYPTVKALAKAPEQDVLRLWQGLGYYSRARNLHKCAKKIVDETAKAPDINVVAVCHGILHNAEKSLHRCGHISFIHSGLFSDFVYYICFSHFMIFLCPEFFSGGQI